MRLQTRPEQTLEIPHDVTTRIPDTPFSVRHYGPQRMWRATISRDDVVYQEFGAHPAWVFTCSTVPITDLPLAICDMMMEWSDAWQPGESATLRYRLVESIP